MATGGAGTRQLGWEGCLNVRDLGGYPAAEGQETCWGAVVRSDNLSPLTEAGRDALRDYGIRSIIDLRMPEEAEQLPNPFAEPGDHSITYANLSFISPDVPPEDEFTTLADSYAGMVSALLLELAGVDRETTSADYALSEECLRPLREESLPDEPGERAEREKELSKYSPRAEVMMEVLERLVQRYGGAEPYLLQAGVAPEDIARLRGRLLPQRVV
jgi:protein-tyrosine phosphatase